MKFFGAIDQGTTSSRFLIFNEKLEVIGSHQLEHKQYLPQPGWVEHDACEILERVEQCMAGAVGGAGISPHDIAAIGITNQRETTVAWDKTTGKPLYHAIVWNDTRTAGICHAMMEKRGGNRDALKPLCGLPLSTYFSGLKMRWLLDNVPEVKQACEEGRCLFGTIDTWLIWNLTGGVEGGVHVTDVTNASRTMLMNLKTLQWDDELCKEFGISRSVLPEIRSSSEVYGAFAHGTFKGVPIAGCLGDQQAATVGQRCFRPGEAKNTYGTGCFLLMNTGTEPVQSTHGLLTTLCYKLSKDGPAVYALEGSIAIAGSGVTWLRDNFGIIKSSSEIEALARSVPDTGNVYFVPAFAGLFAPYWREDARGVIVGLTQFSNKGHLARAVLEATCFQTREVTDAMFKDSSVPLSKLKVDGGMTANTLLMQMQADILGCEVARPTMRETTSLGAAIAAALGVGAFKNTDEVEACFSDRAEVFAPAMCAEDRETKFGTWKKAVQRSFDWA